MTGLSMTSNADAAPPDPEPASRRRPSLWLRLWPLYLIAAGLGAAWYAGLFDVLSLETLRAQQETLSAFVANNLLLAVAAYVAVYALATLFMLPGALWLTIAGGLLFGLAGGTAATVIGATLGASVLFFAAKTSLGKALRERAGPFLKRMERGFRENQISYMFAMRLFPAVPFPVANVAPALLGARYPAYAATTALGIVPGAAAYTWIGASLGASLDPEETQGLFGVVQNFVPAFVALAVVSLLPVAYKKVFGRKAATELEEAGQ